jgi:glycosyltransferase involved in cell wall biosynthesis
MPAIDVMIPTRNESANIADAVASARPVGNVFVLDSLSDDGTQTIARTAGATVVEHPFEGYAKQKNWGLSQLPMTGEWVFILDADERLTPRLQREVMDATARSDAASGYYVNRQLLFMGRRIRHGGLYPSWNLRLFRRGQARYEDRSVHEHMLCDGPTGYLRNALLHVRRESISQYIAKHVRYADLESDEWVKWRMDRSGAGEAGELFSDHLKVRQWLRRELWPRMPLRPLWRFTYMYFARLGFLDGLAGYRVARLMSCYEYMIGMMYRQKLANLRKRER